MSANLVENVKTCPKKLSVRKMYAWSCSTAVLHWLKNNGDYKIFVSNRGSKIEEESFIEWKYVPTKENRVDLGRRCCEICNLNSDVVGRSLMAPRSKAMARTTKNCKVQRI